MLTRKEVCNVILKRMQQRNLTPEYLASISQVHKNTINRIRKEGSCNPRLDTLSLVLDSLGLELVIKEKARNERNWGGEMNDRFKFRVWDIEFKKYYPASAFCAEDLQDSGDEIIVEQCTGLRDMNGKLIYEGDVVHQTVGGLTCRIVFYRGAFCGEFVGGFTSPMSGWFRPDFDEIIGNIHEVEE